MSKHTPGPWSMVEWGETIAINGSELMGIACINPQGNGDAGIPDRQNRANAKLIAAAPELLAALRALITASENEVGTTETYNALVRAQDDARAAIAKATGTTDPIADAVRKLGTEHPHTWNLFVESHVLNHVDSDGREDTEDREACPFCRIVGGMDDNRIDKATLDSIAQETW